MYQFSYGFGIRNWTVLGSFVPSFSLLSSGTITDVGATVAGTIDNGKLETVWSVEYGLTNAYGSTATGGTINAVTAVTKALTGLAQNTLYYWRLKAVNSKGTTYSDGQTLTTTNLRWIIPVTGKTSGTATAGTMVISTTEDITPTVTGDVTMSIAAAADSTYRKQTITINCPNNGSGTLIIPDRTKVVSMGNHGGTSEPNTNFYAGTDATIPTVTLGISDLPAIEKLHAIASVPNSLSISGTKALPTTLKYLRLFGLSFTWTYSGALPSGLTFLRSIAVGLSWSYNGAIPVGMTTFWIEGNACSWSYNGVLPSQLISLTLSSSAIVYNNLDFSGSNNFIVFNLGNWRITKVSSTEMITILTSLTNRVGTLPTTITINDYADYASPPQTVVDAVAALKTAKSITTVNLGA